ncbi:MAG: alpha-N-acetylglucosaminidase C-terminal domain-containing protein [Marinilabiliaceae bacterium]|nr:alpha-N-acetylglucosaminidase C-terminal domain-containing protein [Marinilabiliaceae bacterium]
MMNRIVIFTWVLMVSIGCHAKNMKNDGHKRDKDVIKSAKGVLTRVLGAGAKHIKLSVIAAEDGRDVYEYESADGNLMVNGSSVSALTRGVYDYLKSQHLGMLDWSGPQFRIPEQWPEVSLTRVVTPFKIRHAYNAVTSGYTSPYWTWDRWVQELDWQAMHGFNMLMAPVASEAIMTKVYTKLGLTQKEIDKFYTGPAHLPWSRMGSICQVGGPLPDLWHEDQIALQHKLLKRMNDLGIEPVIQSFNGFVPKDLKKLYPNTAFHETLWNAGFPHSQRPWLIMPNDALFAKITKLYMEEWQKEFGNAKYYLVDSFNELELPKSDKPVTEMLASYGQKTFNTIQAGDADAVWVIQGWMFAYQRHIWNAETVKALFSNVPDDRVLILDYANDYNNNWEPMNAFNGKQWAYGFVPNMGAKTAYTGDLSLYASGAAKALHSPNRKNLVGFTISGEGLENNNVVYELLTDVAWSDKPINLDDYLRQYSINRYGACSEALVDSWKLFRQSCYSQLIPHPQFGWQLGKCGYGSVNRKPEFYKAVQLFLSSSKELKQSFNYKADAIERAALLLGLKADGWFEAAKEAYAVGETETGDVAGKRGLELLTELDHLMESHPLNRLDRWLDFAKSHTNDPEWQQFYESNARQIITVWGPPVNDYSCRVWSGLVRDFYRERMACILEALKTGQSFDKKGWELAWVAASGISQVEPYDDPVAMAGHLVQKALNEQIPVLSESGANVLAHWFPSGVKQEWATIEWPVASELLHQIKGVRFVCTKGNHRLDIREVSLVADGKVVAFEAHEGYAGQSNKKNKYLFQVANDANGNNGCFIRAVVKGGGGTDSNGRIDLIMK